MPQGLQLFDASGNLLVDVTDRITRILGETTTSTTGSGNVSDSRFADGTPFWFLVSSSATEGIEPQVSISGTTLTWNCNGDTCIACRLFYGIY